jgi:hypothetical protein
MNTKLIQLATTLEALFAAQLSAVARWHADEPELPAPVVERSLDAVPALARRMHLANFKLWHIEDQARREDRGDAYVTACKRGVDRMNQIRNDAIEQLDACLESLITPFVPVDAPERYNTETMAAALDRLSISALKIYHMAIEADREDADELHRARCREKLERLRQQRKDLEQSVLELLEEYGQGRKRPNIYRQFKMYNDPATNPELYAAATRRDAHG